MKSQSESTPLSNLYVKRDLTPAYVSSLFAGLLMATISLVGLIFPTIIYQAPGLLETYFTNDAINLVIGLPILLVSLWLTLKGKLVGLLCWPGASLYILYNYLAYLFGMPLSWLTLVYLMLVLSSAYSTFELLRSINGQSVQRQLSGVVPIKMSGWVLVLFGCLFIFRAVGMVATETNLPAYETGTLIADIVISILWVTSGILLLQHKLFGYVSALGLLFVASILFIGLILFLLLQPVFSNTPFALIDVIVVFVMGLVCFIPTWLFARGTVLSQKSV